MAPRFLEVPPPPQPPGSPAAVVLAGDRRPPRSAAAPRTNDPFAARSCGVAAQSPPSLGGCTASLAPGQALDHALTRTDLNHYPGRSGPTHVRPSTVSPKNLRHARAGPPGPRAMGPEQNGSRPRPAPDTWP